MPFSRLVEPTDEAWFLQADMMMVAQAAIDHDTCVFAAYFFNAPDESYERYSRFYRYSGGRWVCAEVSARIVAMMPYREPAWRAGGLAVLGEEGELWFLGEQGYQTRVDVADVSLLSVMKMFDSKLFVAGHQGQIFRRDDDGWRHDDDGLLNVVTLLPRPRPCDQGSDFNMTDLVVTPQSGDAYCCGTLHVARPALFWRPRGEAWSWLGLDPKNPAFDYLSLNGMYAEDSNTIWISTDQGYLLKGNGRDGFAVVNDPLRDEYGSPIVFSNIIRFDDDLFVGGSTVCRLLADGKLEPQQGPAYSRMGDPQAKTTVVEGRLGCAGGKLWAFGEGMLSRFDGSTWTRIEMPTIYKNNQRYD